MKSSGISDLGLSTATTRTTETYGNPQPNGSTLCLANVQRTCYRRICRDQHDQPGDIDVSTRSTFNRFVTRLRRRCRCFAVTLRLRRSFAKVKGSAATQIRSYGFRKSPFRACSPSRSPETGIVRQRTDVSRRYRHAPCLSKYRSRGAGIQAIRTHRTRFRISKDGRTALRPVLYRWEALIGPCDCRCAEGE